MPFNIQPRVSLPAALVQRALGVQPATIGHMVQTGAVDPAIRPVYPGIKFAGPAFTVRITGSDSTALHKAMGLVEPGDVVLIDRVGDTRHACVGEIVAYAAKLRGVAAIVIDGVSTDVVEIRAMNMPVYSRGLSVLTTKLLGISGEINVPIQVGGVTVRPGDLVMGDDNGVLVLPPDVAADLIAAAEQAERAEPEAKRRMESGELLPALFGADALIEANVPAAIQKLKTRQP